MASTSSTSSATLKNNIERTRIDPKERLLTITLIGAVWGLFFGGYEGAKFSGLQYLAERVHKLPKTKEKWYYYHKYKNYRMILGGLKQGFKYARNTGGICLCFGGIEYSLDYMRKEDDIFNTTLAGLSTNRLPKQSTKYACIMGTSVGIITGGIRDLLKYHNEENIWYWDWIKFNIIKRD
nr:3385_t:CDS:2 [Entrophospora candida]